MIYQAVNIMSTKIKFKTSILRSNLCDYSNAYIAVKGTIDLLACDANANHKAQKNVAFKIMPHLDHAFQKLTVH